jgi:predicted extracellular nuclease
MKLLSSALSLLLTLPLLAQEHHIVFYNVENLFDTIDDPSRNDEEFLPGSALKWNTERYEAKLEALARVILAAGGGKPPVLVGLAEVENAAVVRALGERLSEGNLRYEVAHVESPDTRGIDCALLYRPGKSGFKLLQTRAIPVHFPDDSAYTSRDILYVKGKLAGVKEPLHVFVNHWPSRRGGQEASEHRRVRAALALRPVVDSLRGAEKQPLVLITGDFNDEPHNRSIRDVLGAHPEPGSRGANLHNLTGPAAAAGQGSYNYQGNWNMIDQVIVSTALAQTDCRRCWVVRDAGPFREDWMMFASDRYGMMPSRTYGGPNYYGGFSDHLPLRMMLAKQR